MLPIKSGAILKADTRSSSSAGGGNFITGRKVLTNSIWNYGGASFTILATFVTTPIYLHALGLERYGVMAVLAAILAPMGVLNAGVTQATVRFVASYAAQGRMEAARESVAASLLINFLIGIGGAALCIMGAPYFSRVGFKISPELVADAEISLRWMGGVWFLTQISANFRGVLEGLLDQRRVMLGDMLVTTVTALACATLASMSGRLSWFVIGQMGATGLGTIYWGLQARRQLQGLALGWGVARNRMREIYGYSIWQMLNAGVALVANVGDRYFIGIFISATTLGAYNVALRVQSVGRTLFYAVNAALLPAASASTSAPGASERLVVRATWHVALLAGLGLGMATICGPAFLQLWVGPQIAETCRFPLRILLLTLLFEIPSATGASYLNAHALTRLTAYNNVATTLVTLGLLIPLGLRYGIVGVAFSALVGLVVTRAPFHLWMHARFYKAYVSRHDFICAFYGVCGCCIISILLVFPLFDLLYGRYPGVLGFTVLVISVAPLFVGLTVACVALILRDVMLLRALWAMIAAHWLILRSRFNAIGTSV